MNEKFEYPQQSEFYDMDEANFKIDCGLRQLTGPYFVYSTYGIFCCEAWRRLRRAPGGPILAGYV